MAELNWLTVNQSEERAKQSGRPLAIRSHPTLIHLHQLAVSYIGQQSWHGGMA